MSALASSALLSFFFFAFSFTLRSRFFGADGAIETIVDVAVALESSAEAAFFFGSYFSILAVYSTYGAADLDTVSEAAEAFDTSKTGWANLFAAYCFFYYYYGCCYYYWFVCSLAYCFRYLL